MHEHEFWDRRKGAASIQLSLELARTPAFLLRAGHGAPVTSLGAGPLPSRRQHKLLPRDIQIANSNIRLAWPAVKDICDNGTLDDTEAGVPTWSRT